MKTLLKSKTLIATTVIAGLSACGSESYTPPEKENNYAPEHGGDIVKNYHEKDGFEFLYALGGIDGKLGGEGTAIDRDGDILFVTNASVSPADAMGVEPSGVTVGVRPYAVAAEIDTGDIYTVVLSYEVSDGTKSVPRTMTINIEGEDAAPVFDDLVADLTILDAVGVVDLLEGVTDADGEELSISDFVADPTNVQDAHTLDGSTLSIDIASFADTIPGGQSISLVYDYMVNDHNHSLPRKLTAIIKAVKAEPLPPEIISTYVGTFTSNGAPEMIDLGSPEYTVEWNGDPIIIHYDTIMPTDGGPELMFSQSQGTVLVVDPADFTTHMMDGDSQTFNYSFKIGDGDEGETAGHLVDTSFSVTVTKEANANLIENGSFEDGLTGWNADAGVVSVAASATAWDGANELVSTGWSQLTSSTFDVVPGAAYQVYYGDIMVDWGRHNLSITGGATDILRGFAMHPTFAAPLDNYAIHSKSFEIPTDEAASTRNVTIETTFNKLDDVRVARYSKDNGNNLVYVGASAAAVDFEDGTLGGWFSDNPDNSYLTEADGEVISGSYSLVATGPVKLNLPTGTIKDGKKYLLKMDINSLVWNQAWGNVIKLQIIDATTGDAFYAAPSENPRSIDLPNFPIGEVNSFEQVLDLNKVGQLTGWDTRNIAIHFTPNVWGGAGTVVIDNIQLIEIE